MEGHFLRDLPKKRPISLCSNIGPPGSQNALNVAALRRYVETHSRGRKRKASQQSTPETKRNDLQPFLSPVPEPPVDESSTVVVISESDPNTSSLSPTSAVTAIPQPTIETTIPIATSPKICNLKQTKLKKFYQKSSNQNLDEVVALYALGEGLPLTKVSKSTRLQNVIEGAVEHYKLYNEVFELPSYQKLMDTVAPKIIKNVKRQSTVDIATLCTGWTLVIDGSEINDNSLINFCLVGPNRTIFYKCIECNYQSKTADFF
ncbi:hypothetical protein GEMRC1_001179 [Eukaryota sp. GEM-RC1]